MAESPFSVEAVQAFERTYRCLFNQAHQEVERVDRINAAMSVLEENLLDTERIRDMTPMEQIALADLLNRSQQGSIKNLMSFGQMFMNIRTVVGLLDGIQKHTALPGSPVGRFPTMDEFASGEDFTDGEFEED